MGANPKKSTGFQFHNILQDNFERLTEVSTRHRLGDLLLNAGHIAADDLETALARQRNNGRRLGTVLVEAGHITRGQLRRTLVRQKVLRIAAILLGIAVGIGDVAVQGAQAATQGLIGATSVGTINITLTIRKRMAAREVSLAKATDSRGRLFCVTGNGTPLYRVKAWTGNDQNATQTGRPIARFGENIDAGADQALRANEISNAYIGTPNAAGCNADGAALANFSPISAAAGDAPYVLTIVPE